MPTISRKNVNPSFAKAIGHYLQIFNLKQCKSSQAVCWVFVALDENVRLWLAGQAQLFVTLPGQTIGLTSQAQGLAIAVVNTHIVVAP